MTHIPVQRRDDETIQWHGKRRKAQIREWYAEGMGVEEIARLQEMPPGYVRETVGIPSPTFQWEPSRDVIEGPFPSLDDARNEAPIVSECPQRMTTEQAIQRAVQMYRWMMAGMTLREIGERHHVTRERVRRVLDKFGLGPYAVYNPKWVSGTPRERVAVNDPLSRQFWRKES